MSEDAGERRASESQVRTLENRVHELQGSEAQFRRAFYLAPTTMSLSTAKDGRLIHVNDAWVRLTGYSREEALGRRALDLGFFETRKEYDRVQRHIKSTEGSLRPVECRLRVRDGRRVVGLLSADEFEVDGTALRLVSISDITDLRQTQEALAMAAREILTAQDHERHRIATELHDNVGQRFALLQLELERIRREIPDPSDAVLTHIETLSTHVADTATELQNLSHELYSAALRHLPLEQALAGLCASFRERLTVDVKFTSSDVPRTVGQDISHCLYRVLQEALNNAAKHSGAHLIEVDLRRVSSALQLIVRDFGTGFVPTGSSASGIGLLTMRERVGLIHGTLQLSSSPQSGTEIDVRVPLRPSDLLDDSTHDMP